MTIAAQPRAFSYVRFSTPEQERGDSLRRQVELSEKYAREHGLILDDSLQLTDRGLSAYQGVHRTKGALGAFLKLVEDGDIPPGSVLLVESLDRLSREQVLDALNQFTAIIQAGIKVVTLQDGMEYSQESIAQNWAQLIISITYMARAHDESRAKSERIRAVWEHKRAKAREVKLTAKCPAWLKLVGKDRFEVIPEVAEAVNRIFDMKLAGKGKHSIVKELNADPTVWKPPQGGRNKTGGWRESYVSKILCNRAVIGEYQPCRTVTAEITTNNGKTKQKRRVPVGPPIPDYFPPIISREKFNRVQELLKANRELGGNGGGRNGTVSNLFSHLAKCYCCGGSMAYVNKGNGPKGGQYLICDRARRGLGCERAPLRYDHFERLILQYCKGLNVAEILPGNTERQSELSLLRAQWGAVNGELAHVESKLNNVLDSIADTDSKELRKALQDRADALLKEKASLEERKAQLQAKIESLENIEQDAQQRLKDIQELFSYMEQAEGQERVNVRAKLREQLRRLIREIRVDPMKGRFIILFRTGERRLLSLEKGLVFDARPARTKQRLNRL